MRVLFWLEPFADLSSPGVMATWLQWYEQMDVALRDGLDDYEGRLVAFDALHEVRSGFAGRCVLLSQREMRLDWSVPGDLRVTLGHAPWGAPLGYATADMLRQRLQGFEPDVVVLLSESRWLREAFPLSAFLNIEVGWLFRAPYPALWQLDPCGHGKGRFLQTHWDEVLSGVQLSAGERRFLADFQSSALRHLESAPARELVDKLRQPGRNICLLPIAESQATDGQTPMLAIVQWLLERSEPSTHYILTQHPLDKALADNEQGYLQDRFDNISFVSATAGVNTQTLMPWVDEVVSDFSSVALQGLIFGIRNVSVGAEMPFVGENFIHRNPLSGRLHGADRETEERALYWLLTHFSVARDHLFDGRWLGTLMRDLVATHRAGTTGSLFGKELLSPSIWYSSDWLATRAPVHVAAEAKPKRVPSVVRALAFHLPQFHRIPENDRWWGEGFTEWSNVRQGKPLFEGHDQPRVPGELGYYDLSDPEVLARQAALAREYGLEGFCFYHYWFDGRRLLEKPVDQLLQHPEIDLPFCLCWANENWTRRWDGGESEVLVAQSYSSQMGERFALDLLPYMRDPRYIRIDGKPVFLVYRSDIIPDLPGTLATWRETWRQHGIGEVYLIGVESFAVFPPEVSGFDATCEFLPHQVNLIQIGPDRPINLLNDPAAAVADYGKLTDYWLERPRARYKRFRGLVPAWDNASRRRRGGATLFVDSTPERYQHWLERTVAKTLNEFEGEERIVFINAWNEWGEGCYLEPDERWGRAYLEATRRVLEMGEQELLAALPQVERQGNQEYQSWIDANVLDARQQHLLQDRVRAGETQPLTVLVRADAGEPAQLSSTLASLANQQSLPDEVWLCGTDTVLEGWAELPVRVVADSWMDHINSQAATQKGWLLVLHAGDRLVEHACLLLRERLQEQPMLHACYFDEDWQMPEGGNAKPMFKPDFNLDMLRSFPYTGHALLMRWSTLEQFGGLELRCSDLAVHDFMFRAVEQFGLGAVGHLPEVVLHSGVPLETWLANPSFAEISPFVSGSHLYRLGVEHEIRQGHLPGFNHIRYLAPAQPLVSIIVPTRNQAPMLQRCLESLIEQTAYPNYELLVVDNGSDEADARLYLDGLRQLGSEQIRVLSWPHPFNYAAINNYAAEQAQGEYLLLLNNDTAILHADWLDTLVSLAQRPEVGLVGPKLLYPDGTVQHAGVVLGLRGPADHPFLGKGRESPGYMHRLQVEQNWSALTAACLMIPAELYRELGGMDEVDFKVSYNDVDLCLKVRESGYLAVWTPHACLLHEGSVSQKQVDRATQDAKRARFLAEQDAFYARWITTIGHDPAYNKNLSLNASGFEIEGDSALTWRPLHWRPQPVVLVHPADHMGSGHLRVIQPFEALRATGLADGMLSDGLLSVSDLARYAPDSIILQRQYGDARLEAMRRIKELSQAFKVYELDDYLPNLPMKNAHRGHMPKDILKALRKGLAFVDRFVVSTAPLAEAFSGLHSDIRVIENRLPVQWWRGLSSQRRRGRKPRVGWAGGVSHTGDLELIADVVKELATEVEWVFFGMCPEKIRPYVHEVYAGVDIERYPAALASLDLDLALAPVEQNLFNECKSNLRLLEYGACGFPVVCSEVLCYQGDLPVTRVKNRFRDWVDAIRMHIADLDASARMGDELRTKVLSEWMLEGDNLLRWREAWLPG